MKPRIMPTSEPSDKEKILIRSPVELNSMFVLAAASAVRAREARPAVRIGYDENVTEYFEFDACNSR